MFYRHFPNSFLDAYRHRSINLPPTLVQSVSLSPRKNLGVKSVLISIQFVWIGRQKARGNLR